MSDEEKRFFEEQLEWVKDKKILYDKIERKLQEMKTIAEQAAQDSLTVRERRELQEQLNELKEEVDQLSKSIDQVIH